MRYNHNNEEHMTGSGVNKLVVPPPNTTRHLSKNLSNQDDNKNTKQSSTADDKARGKIQDENDDGNDDENDGENDGENGLRGAQSEKNVMIQEDVKENADENDADENDADENDADENDVAEDDANAKDDSIADDDSDIAETKAAEPDAARAQSHPISTVLFICSNSCDSLANIFDSNGFKSQFGDHAKVQISGGKTCMFECVDKRMSSKIFKQTLLNIVSTKTRTEVQAITKKALDDKGIDNSISFSPSKAEAPPGVAEKKGAGRFEPEAPAVQNAQNERNQQQNRNHADLKQERLENLKKKYDIDSSDVDTSDDSDDGTRDNSVRKKGEGNRDKQSERKKFEPSDDSDDATRDNIVRKKGKGNRDKQSERKKLEPHELWQQLGIGDVSKSLRESDMPSDFNMIDSPVDVLGISFNASSLRRPENLTKEVPYLGALLDAGRHYFPIDWIKRMIHVLSIMNFNYLHFRLTDDQTFNIKLKSQPLLAYPTTLENNTKVYSPEELRHIVKYAKGKGIDVIPEINVPGHSASWGGIPDLILQCPEFICKKGYGVPLNVSHPKLRPILKDVLKEVIDIFDNPPFLHLGGDEVNMASPCFSEIGAKMFDYNEFESTLKTILKEIQYDESKVIRWEMSETLRNLDRAGDITHFWLRQPGQKDWVKNNPKNYSAPIITSARLYFDTNQEDSAYDVYGRTKQLKHNPHKLSPVLGIVAATFELSTKFWLDRNVVGRLLAVSMGVSDLNITDRFEFNDKYRSVCKSAGFHDSMCKLYGVPPIRYNVHRAELKGRGSVWEKWMENTCDRLTETKNKLVYKPHYERRIVNNAMSEFWNNYYNSNSWQVVNATGPEDRLVNHTGVIVDLTKYPLDGLNILNDILLKTMVPLGLNIMQFRLITDFAFAYFSTVQPKLQYSNPYFYSIHQVAEYPQLKGLKIIRDIAMKHGVAFMPEISISTNAGGMYKSGLMTACPNFLCEHGSAPIDIHNTGYPPVLLSLVLELSQISTAPYIHLGYDERNMSTPCFLEANDNRQPDFDKFETKISGMLGFAGLSDKQVIRWDNMEKQHYPTRFGAITQCIAGEPCRFASTDEPWFGTVDVRVGGAYYIYNITRDLAAKKPLGIMAEIGSLREDDDIYSKNKIDYRLLAFSIGTLNLPHMNKDEFQKLYIRKCNATALVTTSRNKVRNRKNNSTFPESHESMCTAFAETGDDYHAPHNNTHDREIFDGVRKASCKEQTKHANIKVMKNPSEIETAVSLDQKEAIRQLAVLHRSPNHTIR